MWKKIEDKVEIKIGQKLVKYHVDRLHAEVFDVLERRIGDADKFDSDDMETILDKGLMVFPQNYQSLGWSYDLPLAILNWIPFMIAGYQHQIKQDIRPVYVNVLNFYQVIQYKQLKFVTKDRTESSELYDLNFAMQQNV